MTTKYQPLFELDKLVQLTHSTQGKAIFYSQVHLAKDDNVDEDDAGGWVLSAFTGKAYFEREYRREDLDDLLSSTGDKDWTSFSTRFRRAVVEGYFHVADMGTRECKVIVDNEVHTQASGAGSGGLETIQIEMFTVNHATRGEKLGEFMFECAGYLQGRGCSLNEQKGRTSGVSPSTATAGIAQGDAVDAARGGGVRSYEDLKLERDNLKSENADLKKEIERLHANALKSGASMNGGLGTASGRPKSKAAKDAIIAREQVFKKRKGASTLNPRVKRGRAVEGTEFGDSDDDDDEE
ncbi:hypothetical protein EC957_011269 [Mortierella hygrophila]|uniref:Uncharacterized protein n=1 Tax=Mortierella hygrophila TaxID=979708 RepID=A0A9P6K489_9FUNG|nr:hypothetical protein EC957_011269 [Mortierella hygrophila]